MLLPYSFIGAGILAGRNTPGEVFAHAIAHELLPRTWVAMDLCRLVNGAQQSFSGVLLKFEAGAFFRARVPGVDGVVETAGGAHNGYCPVLQAIDLAEAAGFIARRHQEHVCPGLDFVSKDIVVSNANCDLL